MKLHNFVLSICSLGLVGVFSSCDSGDIYPDESSNNGLKANFVLSFENVDAWPTSTQYNVVLASYSNSDASTPVSYRKIATKPKEGDTISVSLANVVNADYVGVAIQDASTRGCVYLFSKFSVDGVKTDSVTIKKHIDLATIERLQSQLFYNCTSCHGASSRVAASLNLTEGNSYDNLVSVSSKKDAAYMRVMPGNPDSSYIVKVLEGTADSVHYDHSKNVQMRSTKDDIKLLRAWISVLK